MDGGAAAAVSIAGAGMPRSGCRRSEDGVPARPTPLPLRARERWPLTLSPARAAQRAEALLLRPPQVPGAAAQDEARLIGSGPQTPPAAVHRPRAGAGRGGAVQPGWRGRWPAHLDRRGLRPRGVWPRPYAPVPSAPPPCSWFRPLLSSPPPCPRLRPRAHGSAPLPTDQLSVPPLWRQPCPQDSAGPGLPL